MKPGIPWSVKGIEQQARAAAKEAARQSGMTIGEWLNTVILDSAEGGDDLERRYRRPPYRPKALPGAEHGEGEDVTGRLEEIAEQLHTIARHESDTALSRHASPEDENRLRAIVERLDTYEQHTTSALGAMQERLEEVSQRIARGPGLQEPQRAEDIPGYRALEGALRNIIEHIEVSETRTRDSMRSLQERLVEVMDQSGGGPAVGQLEQRVAELAERIGRADAAQPNDLAEVGEAERRLRGLVEEARQAAGSIDSRENQSQLRLEVERLAAAVAQGSSHAVADLGGRVARLEADLKRQFSERDEATQCEMAALGQRIAATEQRLEHLATIEQSVAKLAESLKADGEERIGDGRRAGASPELKALEDGLKAVRASAEIADRRTQDTLQAVHETLEHIVGKLAELEADDGPDEESYGEESDGEAADQAPVEELGKSTDESPGEEASSLEAEPESAWAPPEAEDNNAAALDTETEGFVFPEDSTTEEDEPEAPEEPQMQALDATPDDAYVPVEPADAPVREDYIAAARRAAQMAATRNRNPVTSGFNRFSQRMSGGGDKPGDPVDGRARKRGVVSSLLAGLRGRKAKPSDDAGTGARKSKRKRLIFAGLVLLAAASAYAAQRHAASFPDFDLLGGFLAPDAKSEPETHSGMRALDGLTLASTAPLGRSAGESRPAIAEKLPAEIGSPSLVQAAIGGDAKAQFVVAGRYLDGKAVARDEEQAAQWYALAAKQGLAAAQYRLGSMYEHGRGMAVDRKQAKVWYEQAAELGNINAMHNLAVLLTDASSGQRNYELAAKWFRKAAERGLKDSQFNLAVLNDQGLGLPRSQQTAVFWYSLAAVQGDSEAAAKAKALEATLAPETAKQIHARLLVWRPLTADRNANVVPVGDPSWLEMS